MKNKSMDSPIYQEDNGTSTYVRVEDVVYNRIEFPPIDFKDEWYKGNEWYGLDNIQNTSILDATELGQEESVKRVLVKSKE